MSSVATASPSVKASSRKPLAPVEGTVRVLRPIGTVNDGTGEIRIGEKDYYLTPFPGGFRLTGWDAKRGEVTVYDLPEDLGDCSCPDHIFRPERPGGCRHMAALRALKAAGKL